MSSTLGGIVKGSNTLLALKLAGFLAMIFVIVAGYMALGVFYGGPVGYMLIAAAILTILSAVLYMEWQNNPIGIWLFVAGAAVGIAVLIVDGLARLPWSDLSPFRGPGHMGAWILCSLCGAIYGALKLFERDFVERPARRRIQKTY